MNEDSLLNSRLWGAAEVLQNELSYKRKLGSTIKWAYRTHYLNVNKIIITLVHDVTVHSNRPSIST